MQGPLWIDYAALIAIGFLVYGPIMMIGLHSLDLVPKKAGRDCRRVHRIFRLRIRLGDRRNWRRLDRRSLGLGGVFTTMVACCLLTIFFVSLTLGHKAQSAGLPDPDPNV
jgi:OPA family glycerol-3-phosphate transporter-like MFS transporter